MGFLTYIPLVLFTVTANAVGQVFWKFGLNRLGPFSIQGMQMFDGVMRACGRWEIWVGLLLHGLGVLTWLVVLARMPLSMAAPMASLGYVVAMILGVAFFGEVITLTRALGAAFIMLGVTLVARS